MTVIQSITPLPAGPYFGLETVGVVITSGVPSYFKVVGLNLHNIDSVSWYPSDAKSLVFEMTQLRLVNNTLGSFMIKVEDNYLSTDDRAGKLVFEIKNNNSIIYTVKTYGPVSVGPLWQSPYVGLRIG